ncbi:MAG: sensor histidine kinase KdpD [Coriobacteriales bacterium]|jgi:two-component system sensor histidine kinase KdpD|nr:sensor histidine kinase KdpD [Coriobacteriales bacterium]
MDEQRPNPEGLLGELTKSDEKRGKLKIFFGYAAGVGKTYAMLDEAHELLSNGVDVVAGYIEPHTRAETMHLLEGIPALPPQRINYKNIELREFDLDAALRRHPKIILVDELAHTNANGVRNRKRYQDVEELLDAGIDVYTTLNVQHLESLNNIVSDITKITVNETVPDSIFDRANKVKIVDVEPDELLLRFEEGKIYRPDRAEIAMDNFFSRDNLRLLREIAVRKAADRISHENLNVKQISEKLADAKLIACVSHSPSSAKCIRWAARMAESFYIPWAAVYVEDMDPEDLSTEQKECKRSNLELAERLGAEIVTLSGVDAATAVSEYARLSGITNIVIGKHRRRSWFKADFEERLIGLLPNAEIHVMPDSKPSKKEAGLRARWKANWREEWSANINFSLQDLLISVLLIALATSISYLLKLAAIGDQNIIMVYILSVLLISRFTKGFLYGILSSIISVFLFNFFYTVPYFTFNAIAPGYPITFVIMLAAAIITSTLTGRVKKQARLAVQREQRVKKLYDINRKLLATRGTQNIIDLINDYLARLFGSSVIFYTNPGSKDAGTVLAAAGDDPEFLMHADEKAVANWSYLNKKEAGQGTDTLSGAKAFYIPVVSQGKSLGVIGLSCTKDKLNQDSRSFLQQIVAQTALALERQVLSASQYNAKVTAEKEEMRSNLLHAISHDLRTPLTGILGASSTILENSDSIPDEEKKKLLMNIKDDSSWLIRMIENLLSITRISEDGTSLVKSSEAVEEIISEAAARIRQRFPEIKLSVHVPEEVLIAPMDPILIEQVLINLLENAIKHNSVNTEISLQVKRVQDSVEFEIRDFGSGIRADDLPHLFDGLPSKDSSPDALRGFGIGLSICKSIIDAHGGKIEALNNFDCKPAPPSGRIDESAQGALHGETRKAEVEPSAVCGATFRFSLPLRDDDFGQ